MDDADLLKLYRKLVPGATSQHLEGLRAVFRAGQEEAEQRLYARMFTNLYCGQAGCPHNTK